MTKESVTLSIPHHVKDVVTQILQFFRHLPFIQSSVFASAAGGGMDGDGGCWKGEPGADWSGTDYDTLLAAGVRSGSLSADLLSSYLP